MENGLIFLAHYNSPSDVLFFLGTCFIIVGLLCFVAELVILLQSNTALSAEQEMRLKEMGATVRNGGSYMKKLKVDEDKQRMARNMMNKMNIEQLSELMAFYHLMGNICGDVLERKLHGNVNECCKEI